MNIIDKIANDLKIDRTYLDSISKRSIFYYRDYKIPKNDGGEREISQPSAELKTLQYWVVRKVLAKLPISEAACAYKKGDSIKKHAELHKSSRFILHADITDFFHSIHPFHLNRILRDNKKIFDDLELDMETNY